MLSYNRICSFLAFCYEYLGASSTTRWVYLKIWGMNVLTFQPDSIHSRFAYYWIMCVQNLTKIVHIAIYFDAGEHFHRLTKDIPLQYCLWWMGCHCQEYQNYHYHHMKDNMLEELSLRRWERIKNQSNEYSYILELLLNE